MTIPVVNPTDTFTIWKNVSNSISSSVGDVSTINTLSNTDLVSVLNNELYNNIIALAIAFGTH